MSDVSAERARMAVEVVDLLIEKSLLRNPADRTKKIAEYLGEPDVALRDLLKLVRAAEAREAQRSDVLEDVKKKAKESEEAAKTGGWRGNYEYNLPIERTWVLGPAQAYLLWPAKVRASLRHVATGSKLEMSGDAEAIRWLFTEGPFAFLAEEPAHE